MGDVVRDVVGMNEDGSWAGLMSLAQVTTDFRDARYFTLLKKSSEDYNSANYQEKVQECLTNNRNCEGMCFYFVPSHSQALRLNEQKMKAEKFESKRELKDKLKDLVNRIGWSVTTQNRPHR